MIINTTEFPEYIALQLPRGDAPENVIPAARKNRLPSASFEQPEGEATRLRAVPASYTDNILSVAHVISASN